MASQKRLKLFDTFSREKVPFEPAKDGIVTWYSCGPTVYDASHMGHARNYVSIDINRRILQDYFGYQVKFVQNVTDIDDKIIVRARQLHLFDRYKSDNPEVTDKVLEQANSAWKMYVSQNLGPHGVPTPPSIDTFLQWADSVNTAEQNAANPKFAMHLQASQKAAKVISKSSDVTSEEFYDGVKDILVPVLDAEFSSTIKDPAIFKALPAYWEQKFNEDMAALNVLPPDIVTRVSQYVPEIIDFVKGIVDKNFAYATSDGSVYFDTAAFENAGFSYAKLQPWNKGKQELIQEGEGSLTVGSGKKSKNDFALWKGSKPGEPAWVSPWGEGRPGWHIECSVMASCVLGSHMDIHSGGIDLAFPHHDNEVAQSEAFHGCHEWVKYFLHTGHLHIEGQKMSKSLKNFITIQDALKTYTARQLRLAFAMQQWNSGMDFKESLMEEVRAYESRLSKFFINIRSLLHSDGSDEMKASYKFSPAESRLYEEFERTVKAVDEAFCDNLSTPTVIKELGLFVTKINVYISEQKDNLALQTLEKFTLWIAKILSVMGFTIRPDGLGWAEDNTQTSSSSAEEVVRPFLRVFADYRDKVRQSAIAKAPYSDFLSASDVVRDVDLLNLGVALGDGSAGQPATIKFLDSTEKENLLKEMEAKKKQQAEREQKKAQAAALKLQKQKELEQKASIKPEDLFQTEEFKKQYKEFDEQGIPSVDMEGNPVSKSQKKKFLKLYEQQKKLYNQFNQ